MSESMRPSEFFELEVLPELFLQLDQVYPEFGFKRVSKGWQATVDPGDFGVRPSRIGVLSRYPFCITIAGGETMPLLAYENGGTMPSGRAYVDIIRHVAEKVGVDASVLDGKKLTPAEEQAIEKRRQERREQAKMRQREAEKQQAQDDANAIAGARELIGKAVAFGHREVAEQYFTRRGRVIEHLPGGQLPASVQYVPDCGFREMTRAVLGIVINERYEPCGAQRIFVDNAGKALEVSLGDEPVRKATIGRPFGGWCQIGEPCEGEPIVLCEGVETGVALHECTGWPVRACISAGGMEEVSLALVRNDLEVTGSVVIVAGDLDRSKINNHGQEVGLAGQRACVRAADRIREQLRAPTAELLPSHANTPQLVDANEQPAEGKSVDWEDAINLDIERVRAVFEEARTTATTELSEPELEEQAAELEPEPDVPQQLADEAAEEQQAPKGRYKLTAYADVYPKNQLDAAYEFLLAHYAPKTIGRDGGGLELAMFSGQPHLYQDGMWVPIDAKPLDLIRPEVQRYFRKHCKAQATKESPPRIHYVDANLSKSECDSVAQAAIDEVAIPLPKDDFRAQFWLHPNIDSDGDIVYAPRRDRVIWRPQDLDPPLPDAEKVIPTIDGIIDLEAWRDRGDLVVLKNTPLLFNLGRIEARVPVGDVNSMMKGGLDDLEEFASSMCPEWIEFLQACFDGVNNEQMHHVIRELHKVIGNLIIGGTGHQQGGITWLIGPSGSGKSVLLKVIQAILGKSNIVSSTMAQLDSDFHLSSWIGKKVAIFPDMDFGRQDKRAVVERIKMISAGDEVSINRKFMSEIPAHRLSTRFVIAANNIPSIPDPTQAIARRSIAFELPNAIPFEQQDANLADRLISSKSLTGIFLLALVGIKRIDLDEGFTQPSCYQSLIDDLKDQASDYKGFIEQYLKVTNDPDDLASERDIWSLWSKYREDEEILNRPKIKQFMAQLKTCLTGIDHQWRRTDVVVDEERHTRVFKGLKLNDRGLEHVTQATGEAAGGFDRIPA